MWVSRRGEDLGSDIRVTRGEVAIVDRRVAEGGIVVGKGAVSRTESMLAALNAAGALQEPGEDDKKAARRYEAGRTFRSLWRRAGLDVAPRSCLHQTAGGGQAEMSDAQAAAMARVNGAMAALGEDGSFAVDVICFNRWPGISGLPRTRAALTSLADHWRMS